MNMATSKRNLNDKIRADYMARVRDALTQAGDEILVTGSNEFAIPCVNAEGDDEFIVITFKVPTGSRDGDPYDGYAVAQEYSMKLAEKAEKAKEAAAKKANGRAARDANANFPIPILPVAFVGSIGVTPRCARP